MTETKFTLPLVGILAAVILATAALIVAVIALLMAVRSAEGEIHLVDRREFTVDLVIDALERYDDEGLEATLGYYNSPESLRGEW